MNLGDLARKLYPFIAPLFIESGTFTPAFVGTGTAGTFTYAGSGLNGGSYTRIGNVCLIRFRCQITATSVSPTGDLTITGLPFTSATVATDVGGGVALLQWTGITFTAGAEILGARIPSNESRIRLVMSDSAGGAAGFLQGSGLAAAATVMGVGLYEVA